MRVRYVATATVLILAAVLAACGSGSGEQTEPVESVATAATATAATEPVVVAAPEGPPVPAVTLELDDGSTFVTTDATRPVLYVFWAEW